MKNKKVIINNFRNIFMPTESIKNSKEQNGNQLILSHNANEGSIVTIIGPNNVGKSNILDAINCKANEFILNKPDWEYLWDEKNHKISVSINDASMVEHNLAIIKKILDNAEILNKNSESYQPMEIIRNWFFEFEEYGDLFEIFNEDHFDPIVINKHFLSNKVEIIILLFYLLHENICSINNIRREQLIRDIMYLINDQNNNSEYNRYFNNGPFEMPKVSWKSVLYLYEEFKKSYTNIKFDEILLELKYNEQNVMKFDDNDIIKAKSLDFNLKEESLFLKKLKNIIDIDDIDFKSIINLVNSKQPEGIISGNIDNIIFKLNAQISENITKKFNDLYFLKNERYDFRIQRLDSYTKYAFKISLIKENGETIVLNLDKQSDGFKWFFNFYFQILIGDKFEDGLIVLLEEPATNLHIEAQKQWLKFVREFALKNKITFVMTTHSPFLVDCDHLDEVRIVYKEGEFCKINNYFSVDASNTNKGALQLLIDSFTWHNIISTLINKNDQLVLVEGITDYIYLNHFKLKLKEYDNLHFLPINGLGKINEIPKIIENVINYFGSNSFVLIDDDKVGNEFAKLVKDKKTDLKVIKISDTNSTFKVIEDLFSEKDINKFNYIKEKRTSKIIGLCNSSEEVFDEETKSNFIALLKDIKNRL